jgi:hypothetical protein
MRNGRRRRSGRWKSSGTVVVVVAGRVVAVGRVGVASARGAVGEHAETERLNASAAAAKAACGQRRDKEPLPVETEEGAHRRDELLVRHRAGR